MNERSRDPSQWRHNVNIVHARLLGLIWEQLQSTADTADATNCGEDATSESTTTEGTQDA